MFQYAFGKALSLEYNKSFYLDISKFETKNYAGRNYALSRFKITEKTISSLQFKKLRLIEFLKGKKIFNCDEADFSPKILDNNKNVYLKGFWHSYHIIQKYNLEISDCFQLKETSIHFQKFHKKIEKCTTPIAIHIRRGDYVNHSKIAQSHGALPISYYLDSRDIVSDLFKEWTPVIFTDDWEWAFHFFLKEFEKPILVDRSIPDYEQLILLSKCKHQIIANSTFSWWGAWLNNNPQKRIIAPKNWFKGNPNWNSSFLLPKEWILINNKWKK